jgi:hypothetical protein
MEYNINILQYTKAIHLTKLCLNTHDCHLHENQGGKRGRRKRRPHINFWISSKFRPPHPHSNGWVGAMVLTPSIISSGY